MHWIDWLIILIYLGCVTAIGFLFIKRASGSVAEYFVAGRNLPWWLAGTSIVATSFAADTPLFVAGLIATRGIAGNWLWWNQGVAWALAIVFFARLWRRSGVITDAEFIELRYGGRVGAFLRGFRAVVMSTVFSTCTIAWVMLAMQKIVAATIAKPAWAINLQRWLEDTVGFGPEGFDSWKWIVLISLFLIATLYTVLSGFWGIVVTDLVQFVVAFSGAIVFAVFALYKVGGMTELKEKLLSQYGSARVENLYSFFPEFDSPWMPVTVFAIYLSVLWWGDCNGFVAQRMFSTRNEGDAVASAVWYSIAHFALRPWPWIIVGLVAMVYYPGLEDPEMGYPMLLMEILPVGIKGVLVASLLAAFMSTIDTHLNWNASYFVTDIYKRFISPEASEQKCVSVSRYSVIAFAALAIIVAYFMTSIEAGVLILFNLQAGIGMVLMLRWFWWRINAWSEISAMVASLIITSVLPLISTHYELEWSPAMRILLTVFLVTPIWLSVTLLTPPADMTQLEKFYRRVRPVNAFWGPIAARCPEVVAERSLRVTLIAWFSSTIALYSLMYTVGKLIFLEYQIAATAGCVFVIAGIVSWRIFATKNPLAADTQLDTLAD